MFPKGLGISSERSDDIPLIIHWLTEMRIVELIDENLPVPHGNRQGLSYGQLSVLLLTYDIYRQSKRPSTLRGRTLGEAASENIRAK